MEIGLRRRRDFAPSLGVNLSRIANHGRRSIVDLDAGLLLGFGLDLGAMASFYPVLSHILKGIVHDALRNHHRHTLTGYLD